ncbi:HlyD family secretion protein [Clostridium cellulovorans]|uniref:CusB-like beta-barrel domain-containing protein n=1 Tax=Clostridium cellulovorans (strain ATCC 35296 / DSM 3052 / OCM 3 / 743B) TaxID=573061 RepID=D9SR68_CLOC7|nr:HlyD family efflux transporter periplasmic adaptor subunit [Clostridium cellulovorans]ADL50356.1 hypothetical protein Clocel_0585 [Clostridium cellulovorans 743B]
MKKLFIMFLIAAAMTTLTACSESQQSVTVTASNSTEEASSTGNVQAYGVIKSGTVKNINVNFPTAVEEIYVKAGQKVTKGEKLVRINISEYEGLIKNKEHEARVAQLEVQSAQNGENIDLQNETIRKLNEDLVTKQGYLNNNSSPEMIKLQKDLTYCQNAYNKAKSALDANEAAAKQNKLSSATELEESRSKEQEAFKALEDVKFDIDTLNAKLKEEIGQIQSDISKAQIQQNTITAGNVPEVQTEKLNQLNEEIALMRKNLEEAFLKDGIISCDVDSAVVGDVISNVGEAVEKNVKLLSLIDTKQLIVEADISEEFYKDVKQGATVKIIPIADKSKEYTGKVTYIASNVTKENTESIIKAQITIENADEFLLPGLNVNLQINAQGVK